MGKKWKKDSWTGVVYKATNLINGHFYILGEHHGGVAEAEVVRGTVLFNRQRTALIARQVRAEKYARVA